MDVTRSPLSPSLSPHLVICTLALIIHGVIIARRRLDAVSGYVCMSMCLPVYIHVNIVIRLLVHACVYKRTNAHVHIHSWHTHIHTYTHVHTHIHTHLNPYTNTDQFAFYTILCPPFLKNLLRKKNLSSTHSRPDVWFTQPLATSTDYPATHTGSEQCLY